MIRSDCTQKMQSPHRFGLISSDLKMRGSSTKISWISPLKVHHYSRMSSFCASKPPSNWTRSGALAIALLGLMLHITLLSTKESNYSRSSLGTVGDMVCNNTLIFVFTQLTRDRCACCLDAGVKRDNGNHFLFRCLGPGRFSRGPTCNHYDRSRSGANCRARGCIPDI